MDTDITAVTIQSNKTVSNEVKDNQVLLEPSYGKNRMNIRPIQYYYCLHVITFPIHTVNLHLLKLKLDLKKTTFHLFLRGIPL